MSRNQSYFFAGKENEKRFRDLFDGMRESTRKEDMYQKFDMELKTKIDYKGLKKLNRSDKEYNENIHWVELLNVRGDRGWLYGEADVFVFELINYWLVVEKKALQNLILDRVVKETDEEGNRVYSKEPWRLWQRKGKKDLITLVPTVDLVFISSNMIKK